MPVDQFRRCGLIVPGQQRDRLHRDAAGRQQRNAQRGSSCGQVITGNLRSKDLVALACSELYRLFQKLTSFD
jgi:hypothetical protein